MRGVDGAAVREHVDDVEVAEREDGREEDDDGQDGLSIGSVMYQKRAPGPAPSASAASYSSRGMDTSPARMVMAKKGSPRQTLTTTTAVIA